MTLRSRRALSAALITAISFFTAACTDNGRDPVLSQIETVPPAPSGPQGNQNISNPTLTIAENLSVSPGDTLTLVWSDEFDAASLDPETWFFATGDGSEAGLPGGWGNAELQYYLPDNAQIENGVLKITARRESIGGLNYTSARINTEDRFAFRYGRIEASIKLPSGQGLWPAFWMLPQDSPYGEWAAKGEIDIVEAVNLDGSNGNEIFATIHYGGEFPANQSSSVTYVPGPDVTEDFHTYALEWDETEIRWYFDDSLYAVQNNWSSTAAPYPAPFDQPFHILLNLAVGGNFPGFAVDSSVFPATMEVDWVRVYSGEEASVPADPGTIPDVVIYATDPNVPVDLVFGVDYTGFDAFGSGSVFDNNVMTDADFNPSFGVTTGDGYGAQVGQFAIVGFAAGFATGYETLDFKAKNLNNDLIRVKFLDAGDYIDITLSSSSYATDLGNGWYQVSVPLADFTGVDTATGLLFETDNTAASAFQFLLTDFGFSGTAGAAPGIVPEVVIYATDPNVPVDLVFGVDYTGFDAFGSGSVFDNNVMTDADFNPSFGVTTGDGYGAQVGQFAIVGFAAGFATGYETLDFKAKNLNNDLIRVKFLDAGDYIDITLSSSSYATDLGNGWYQVSVPLADFTGVDTATGLLFETDNTAASAFQFLLTDFGFSGTAGAAPGIVPEVVIYATDPNVPVDLVFGVDYTGFDAFGSGSVFDNNVTTDADFNPSFGVTTGNGYGAQVGQFAIVGFAAGFATGYETLDFKAKGLNNDLIRVKFLDAGDYIDITLSSSSYATDLGNGWYQVSVPLADFTGVDTATGLLFETDNTAASAFQFLLTDFGFSGTANP